MKFSAQRDSILSQLQHVIGAVERKQTTPILGNVLVEATDSRLSITGSDSEIEIKAVVDIQVDQEGSTTVPARKFVDICKNLPEDSKVNFSYSDNKVILRSSKSRFTLATLSADEYPKVKALEFPLAVEITAKDLHRCIRTTSFSMAQQDVRFYLNGMLLEIDDDRISCVATDGHRLAYSNSSTNAHPETPVKAIIPRKSIGELQRLLSSVDPEETIALFVTPQYLQLQINNIRITTKLLDGRFPDYNRVIPIDGDKEVVIDCQMLKQALTRVSILSNEKYRGIRLSLESGLLTISSNNPNQEEAVDQVEIDYAGESTEIGFNVTYLLDALNNIESVNARILLKDGGSSALVCPEDTESGDSKYVVMPMRL